MSVINQMLKDLENRPPEPNAKSAQPTHNALVYSPRKVAIISGLCVFSACVISFYVWQLVSENNALKADRASYIISEQVSKQVTSRVVTPEVSPTKKVIAAQISTESNDQLTQPIRPIKKAEVNEPKALDRTASNNSTLNKSQHKKITIETGVKERPVVNNNVSRVLQKEKSQQLIDEHSHSGVSSDHDHDIATRTTDKAFVDKMSVSRRQLSADELADQKLALAEKAIAAKQINKAEKLLEDVVIIKPSDSQTRKKLAALWFGRQAYQDAVNILSQGIALNGQDSSLREMKARILIKLGRFTAALNTLKPLANLKDEQYQVMLANTAQQAQQNKVAVDAYNMLIVMQPDQGRWQLGLAVLYDKNSQFNLASSAYKKALTKNDLSLSSENFIKQRIEVIGQ
jgi:MSHA biogenesis protein MshN